MISEVLNSHNIQSEWMYANLWRLEKRLLCSLEGSHTRQIDPPCCRPPGRWTLPHILESTQNVGMKIIEIMKKEKTRRCSFAISNQTTEIPVPPPAPFPPISKDLHCSPTAHQKHVGARLIGDLGQKTKQNMNYTPAIISFFPQLVTTWINKYMPIRCFMFI